MTSMREHLRLKKIQFLYEVKEALFKDFNIEIELGQGFTKSDMFHFVVIGDKKYVYKNALKFILTNGDTYNMHQPLTSEFIVNKNPDDQKLITDNIQRMFDFFRNDINNFKLYPELLEETENFFVFRYYDENWEKISSLDWKDSRYISKHFVRSYKGSKETISPFYNNMYNKLMKNMNSGEIKMVDIKSLEFRKVPNLAIYMYSDITNNLYLLDWRFVSRKKLIEPYSLDYPAEGARIIKHYVL